MLTGSVLPVVQPSVSPDFLKLGTLGILNSAVFISPTEFKVPVSSVEAVEQLRSELHEFGIYNVRALMDPELDLVAVVNLENYFDDEGGASQHLFYLSMRMRIQVVYTQVTGGSIVIHCTDRDSASRVCTGLNKYLERSFHIEADPNNSLDVIVVTNGPGSEIDRAA